MADAETFSMRRCALALALSFPIVIVPFIASAAEVVPYTSQAFAAAQKAGDPILVEITASWCPTCKAQKPILSKLESDPKFKDLKVFDVDFDSQKDVVRNFKATMQSTLITFKGDHETARSVGDTNPDSIGALLEKAI
jgi:thiol-disulfide isomerase/thioredoxin